MQSRSRERLKKSNTPLVGRANQPKGQAAAKVQLTAFGAPLSAYAQNQSWPAARAAAHIRGTARLTHTANSDRPVVQHMR
jgi:hypothetical protein